MTEDLDSKSDPIRVPGSLRRNALLLGTLVAVFVVGPTLSRVLRSYRAVVLQRDNDRVFLGFTDLPPRWETFSDGQPGELLVKDAGSWSPHVEHPQPADKGLSEMADRFRATYEGVIVQVQPPAAPGGMGSAVVERGDETRVRINLAAGHLVGVKLGDRVRKEAYTWDPVIVTEEADSPSTAVTKEGSSSTD